MDDVAGEVVWSFPWDQGSYVGDSPLGGNKADYIRPLAPRTSPRERTPSSFYHLAWDSLLGLLAIS
jgi:hypothetical protein